MNHAQLISFLMRLDIPVSPYMQYWRLVELQRYTRKHAGYLPDNTHKE